MMNGIWIFIDYTAIFPKRRIINLTPVIGQLITQVTFDITINNPGMSIIRNEDRS